MDSPENRKETPVSDSADTSGEQPSQTENGAVNVTEGSSPPAVEGGAEAGTDTGQPDPYEYYDDTYPYDSGSSTAVTADPPAPAPPASSGGGASGSPPAATEDESDADDDGMLRMSFLEHLEELRDRLLRALFGVGIAFVLSLTFSKQLWLIVSAPAVDALRQLGVDPPRLAQITPMEAFNVIWLKLPMLTAVFLASPWVVYQVWAFIAPGLYKRERRWAVPFVLCSAGLFIAGGLFAYFVAFRFGLTFLLGIGRDSYILPLVSVSEYFNLFVNVTLGVGVVFELPILIFFLTLLRIVTPRFLIAHTRYAILGIVVLAAVITPTPDVFNLMIFAIPMILLYFVGVFASWILVLHREEERFPWRKALYAAVIAVAAIAVALAVAVVKYGYQLAPHWPFFYR